MRVLIRSNEMHVYEVRSRKDKRCVDLISNALPFGALWYAEPNAISNAIDYADSYSRSLDVQILSPMRCRVAIIGDDAVRRDELGVTVWPPPPLLPQPQNSPERARPSSRRNFMV